MKYSTALVILSMVAIATCMPNPQRRRQHRPQHGHHGQGFDGGYGNQGFGGQPGYGNQGFGGSG